MQPSRGRDFACRMSAAMTIDVRMCLAHVDALLDPTPRRKSISPKRIDAISLLCNNSSSPARRCKKSVDFMTCSDFIFK